MTEGEKHDEGRKEKKIKMRQRQNKKAEIRITILIQNYNIITKGC